MPNKIIPYNPKLKQLARDLRKQRILSEVLLWQKIKGKSLGFEFHRQVPLLDYIVDFYCHELMMVIEIDGNSHSYEEAQVNDKIRQQKIEEYGVTFLRFTDIDVKQNLNNVLMSIENKIGELSIV